MTFFIIGFVLFLSGIRVSTLMTTTWVAVGTMMAVGGGWMMGSSLPRKGKRKERGGLACCLFTEK
ncbi:hypothetical protein [Alteribacter keqinensis]|uniref:Uncharacterized protein n=1 Tax=Alteribacter keqinensis TaxID=2483800 RepID=A0A3M7TNC8_9BACI|nr:hypothetical protein [Alteribacter keqinensis]RNA66898.1 hypothetical protein EBO34_16990 [Alteribacter keqinensis]